ncbi:predicted protein [Naegleria gruberi]|uniref:Predicted protein n=1 Tax=Naegleria gruberi TaxID=5762 RepID=D2UY31_NAEGR|nr:uncharacterized protein NAEGRDRAFT_56484 [Naegleria gruberi]EFC50401.1 predicted protein [Naegleria gruberi]|eukprot:XP_002683145.1 predicted protein [Naegleria gruberi strain NEG-M]
MSGISAFLGQGGSKPTFIPSNNYRGEKPSNRHSEKSSDHSGDHHGVSFGGSYIKHISENDRPMRRRDYNNRDSNYRGNNRGGKRDFNNRGRDYRKDFYGGYYKREDEFGSKSLPEEKDEESKAEEEALALKLAEQDESLQAIGSEFFIPVEQEYDMFLKKLVNWKNDSHSISQKMNDGAQLKQFREYDEEASQQTKDLMLQIFKSNSQTQAPKSICATTDRELTSTFKNSVSDIQEDVARGRNKNYGLLDKTILHYEDIMYSLWKAPLVTDRKSEKDTESTLEEDSFAKFHEEFERENNEKKEIDTFSKFADELFEKCTDLYRIAEKAPLFDVTQDEQMQEAIQSVIDTSKKSVYKNTDGPHDAGHLFFAVSDLLGRKDEREYASDRKADKSLTNNNPKRSRDDYESEEENLEEDRQVKATTTFELLGDRFRLLPEIHKYENYLKRSMGVTGLDYNGKTSLNNRKKQIRLDSSVAMRHEWMDKEPKETAKLATPHTHLSKMVLSLSEKCKQVVDSLLY